MGKTIPLLTDRAYERIRHDIISCAIAHDVFELRLMLEPLAARMAAGKVNTQRLRVFGETAERVCRDHIEASRNRVLCAILTSQSVLNLAITADGA